MENDDELRRLRERVQQLEATIAAMQAGQLDAVIGTSGAGNIYTLESEERPFRLMVERMAEGALTLDDSDGRVLYCNAAFASMIRRPLGTVMGRRFADFIPEGKRDEAERIVRLTGSRRFNTTLVRGDGVVPVAIAAATIESPEGNTICVIVSDLSQRRIAERLRRKQTALETEAHRKDEFIAMLGHELRNPLAPIQHAAELLHDGTLSLEQVRSVRGTILRQTVHMRRLVDDLLDSARISRGSLTIHREDTDARDVISAALEVTEHLFVKHARLLNVELGDDIVPLHADVVRLTQVITNLIGNAVKFTQEGDQIIIRLTHSTDLATIEVSDTGRGIEPEMLDTIFTAFVQEDVVFDSAVGGLGLGLALVKRIVELHGGEVAASSPGRGDGATFTITLPLRAEDQDAQRMRSETPPGAASRPRNVLVCDDNTDAAEMMALLLEASGHQVTTVHTGEDAVREAVKRQPDILFLDIGLPGIDGYEVARQLRGRDRTSKTVIAALTGYGQAEDREAAISAGCDLHLVKPVDRSALTEALAFRRAEASNT